MGISHPKYVEVPVAFLELTEGAERLGLKEVQRWVRKVLGRHKAPSKIFLLGSDYKDEVPLTGSGKIKKFQLRAWADALRA